MDIYLFSTIANIFWQLFTVLFVLYRYTSFFSVIYNFLKFLSKIFKGFIYVKDKISMYFIKRSGYNLQQMDLETRPKTLFQTVYYYFFPNVELNTTLPLYETRTSFANELNLDTELNFESIIEENSNSVERDFYSKHSSDNIRPKNLNYQSNYNSSYSYSSLSERLLNQDNVEDNAEDIILPGNRFNLESNLLLDSSFIKNNFK